MRYVLTTQLALINLKSDQDASYTLNADHAVVVGLPPPTEGTWYRARNYGLTESLLGIALKVTIVMLFCQCSLLLRS